MRAVILETVAFDAGQRYLRHYGCWDTSRHRKVIDYIFCSLRLACTT